MKLCDRCKVSGCCLDYLGPSCAHARKESCPDVQPTNAEAMAGMELDELAEFLAGWVSNIWVDAVISPAEVLEWLNELT